jgi:hypothetical protein
MAASLAQDSEMNIKFRGIIDYQVLINVVEYLLNRCYRITLHLEQWRQLLYMEILMNMVLFLL